jgi:hypothetical protein
MARYSAIVLVVALASPLAEMGGRSAIKAPENVRPDPFSPGSGRARLFGPRPGL